MSQPPSAAAGMPAPEMILGQILWSPLLQRSVCLLAQLGVPDLLASEPQTAAALAQKVGAHEPSLYRVLRAVAGAGILSEREDHRFELTPISQLLRSDVPGSMRDLAVMFMEEWQWRNWGELTHSVMTGEDTQRKIYGMDSFEYFAANKEVGAVFNRAMTGLSAAVAPAIAEAYDFSRVRTVVEIAGGHGLLIAAMLQRNPAMRGVLFDLPDVIAGASDLLEKEGIRDRVEPIAGDFFQSVTPGADLYTMKHVIHDWDDEKSLRILRNVRSAMDATGRVLIIEMVVPEGDQPSPAKILDLQMLLMEGGKERTAEEYKALYEAADFELVRIVPTKSPFSLIEGKPA